MTLDLEIEKEMLFMSRKKPKNQEQRIKCDSNIFSREKIIEIQAEAYYRALKRIEAEKSKSVEPKSEKKKCKWYENVLFVLNVFFWPWTINKKFCVNNRFYDSILVLFVSGALQIIGGLMWLFGIVAIIYELCLLATVGFAEEMVNNCFVVMFSLFLGSTFVLAGKEFGKETDSSRIYAYSASIIALISCIVSIIVMIGI